MSIALIHLGGNQDPLVVTESLSHDIVASTLGDGWLGEHQHRKVLGHAIAYVLRPRRGDNKPPALWITGQTLQITGRIANTTDDDALSGWKAGFLQSVLSSLRVAHYADGSSRQLRLNTVAGPLKDGDKNDIFYVGTKCAPLNGAFTTELEDSPNFEMPLRRSDAGPRLVATSGSDHFCSHLVLVRGKTIIDLSQLEWTIDWSGRVDWTQGDDPRGIVWTPTQAASFLTAEPRHQADLYADLDQNPKHTPFSLDLNEAEKYCEILDNGKWKRCSMRGDTSKGSNAAPRSWRKY